MRSFKRSFWITLAWAAAIICGTAAAAAVSAAAQRSGFSSGEFFVFAFDKGALFGEVFGSRFSFDFSPAIAAARRLEPLAVLLPPWYQLLLRFIISPAPVQ